MLSMLFIYFNHYHDSESLNLIYFVGLKCIRSHWSMRSNVEFRIGLPKTNPDLAKSHLQRKTCGYAQKTAADTMFDQSRRRSTDRDTDLQNLIKTQ